MIRHAARALPWPLLAISALLVAGMLRIVAEWPYTMWPLQGIAVGLLAGVVAFAYDEPAAAVVDTLPRGLAWRTGARSLGTLLMLGWWVMAVYWTREAYFGHPVNVAWQGLAATVAVVGAVTYLRRQGLARPAAALATGVVGAAIYLALARPLDERVPLLPYLSDGPWDESRQWWTAVLVGGVVWLTITLRR